MEEKVCATTDCQNHSLRLSSNMQAKNRLNLVFNLQIRAGTE